MATDFLSDDQMLALEKAGKAKPLVQQQAPSSGGFLSDEQMSALEKGGKAKIPEIAKPSQGGQAALESFGQAATLGHLPQIQAGTSRLASLIREKFGMGPEGVDQKLREQGFNIVQPEQSFVSERDENIERIQRLQKENPGASLAGTTAGILSTIPLTTGAARAMGFAPAATRVGRVGQAAGTGGALSALQNPGDKKGEVSPFQLEERLPAGVKGAATGALVQGVFESFTPLARFASQKLGKRSAEKATKALGGTQKQVERLQRSGQDVELGRELLQEGAIPVLGTPGRIAGRVEKLKEKAGQRVGDLIESAGDSKVIDAQALAAKISQDPDIASIGRTPGLESLGDRVTRTLETFAGSGKLSLKEAQKLRQDIDKSINFNKGTDQFRGMEQVLFKIRSSIRDSMDEAITALKGAEEGTLKEANRSFSRLSKAEDLLEGAQARASKNRSFGLTDTIAATAGFAGGQGIAQKAVLAAALGAANKAARTFGASAGARMNQLASNIARKTSGLGDLARRNPEKAQAFIVSLLREDEFDPSQAHPLLDDPELFDILRKNPKLLSNIQDQELKSAIEKKLGRNPSDENAMQRRLRLRSSGNGEPQRN